MIDVITIVLKYNQKKSKIPFNIHLSQILRMCEITVYMSDFLSRMLNHCGLSRCLVQVTYFQTMRLMLHRNWGALTVSLSTKTSQRQTLTCHHFQHTKIRNIYQIKVCIPLNCNLPFLFLNQYWESCYN